MGESSLNRWLHYGTLWVSVSVDLLTICREKTRVNFWKWFLWANEVTRLTLLLLALGLSCCDVVMIACKQEVFGGGKVGCRLHRNEPRGRRWGLSVFTCFLALFGCSEGFFSPLSRETQTPGVSTPQTGPLLSLISICCIYIELF